MTKQPNIILILIDDMGWMDLACQGSPFYETPNIDRLANEGMTFTDAYAACPVSSPTRASILSGRYPARVGVTQFIGGRHEGLRLLDVPYVDHLDPANHTVAAALRDGGYQTWHVGKWHLGEEPYFPEKQGFDVNVGGCHWGAPKHGYFSPWKHPTLPDGPDGEYLDDRLGDEAAKLIRERDADKPFFMNMCFYLVHTPLQAPEDLVQKYRDKAKAMGLNDDEACELGEIHPKSKGDRIFHVKRRRFQSHPVYAAMIEKLDQNVGKILDTLADLGIADDTVVMFTSDNGGLATSEGSPTCNAPLREGKGWMEEGGIREPLLVRWPGTVAPASQTDAYMTSPDFYPTFLDIAGLDPIPEQHCDGISFLPALKNQPFERGPIYWHYPHYSNQGGTPAAAIREGDFKLIEFFEDSHVELYNVRDDISETNDLAHQMPQRAFAMQQQLEDWRIDVEAIIPQPNPDYVPPEDPAADPAV